MVSSEELEYALEQLLSISFKLQKLATENEKKLQPEKLKIKSAIEKGDEQEILRLARNMVRTRKEQVTNYRQVSSRLGFLYAFLDEKPWLDNISKSIPTFHASVDSFLATGDLQKMLETIDQIEAEYLHETVLAELRSSTAGTPPILTSEDEDINALVQEVTDEYKLEAEDRANISEKPLESSDELLKSTIQSDGLEKLGFNLEGFGDILIDFVGNLQLTMMSTALQKLADHNETKLQAEKLKIKSAIEKGDKQEIVVHASNMVRMRKETVSSYRQVSNHFDSLYAFLDQEEPAPVYDMKKSIPMYLDSLLSFVTTGNMGVFLEAIDQIEKECFNETDRAKFKSFAAAKEIPALRTEDEEIKLLIQEVSNEYKFKKSRTVIKYLIVIVLGMISLRIIKRSCTN